MLHKSRVAFIEPKPPRPHVYSRTHLPRLGTLILATILRRAGYNVEVFIEESSGIDYNKVLAADVVGISTITSTSPHAYELADQFRAAGKTVIMGGAHPSFMAEEALGHCDYVVRGEAEEAILPLIQAIDAGRSPGAIPGLSMRDKHLGFVHFPSAPLISDLDRIPAPDYALVHGHRQMNAVVSVSTSRGCPFGCKFCSVIQMFGRQYRFNSLERVMQEIHAIAPHTKHIFFCDDNFTANVKRTKAILRRVRDEKLKLEYSAQVRVEAARDPELLDLMQETGCYGVYVGFESINERTLQAYNKHQDLAMISNCIEQFRAHHVHVHGMFVFGSDEDDPRTIHDTAVYCRQAKVDSVQFMILTPFPGTPTYSELNEAGRIFNRDWAYYDGSHAVFEPAKMTAYELESETIRAMDDFYKWNDVVAYALRGDWKYGMIRLFAKRLLGKGHGIMAPYFDQLKNQAVLDVTSGGEGLAKKPKAAAVILDWINEHPRQVLLQFLKNLGINATSVSWPDFNELVPMASARTRMDLVILPVCSSISRAGDGFSHNRELTREWLQKKVGAGGVCLVPDLNEEELYKSLTQLGLALNHSLSRIRNAYLDAVKAVAAKSPPPTR